MESTIVVKQNTRSRDLVRRTAEQLGAGPVGWSVPKRHARAANEAAEVLSAEIPGFRFSRLHGAAGEYVYLCSTRALGIGDTFAYWPPSKGPQDTYDLIEQDDGSIVGVLRQRD